MAGLLFYENPPRIIADFGFVGAPDCPGAAASAERFALVIGNAKYPDAEAPLKEPINDARAVADELKRDGFNVEIGENLLDRVLAAEAPDPHGREHLEVRRQRAHAHLEAHLIVALPGAPVRDGIRVQSNSRAAATRWRA